ncbi:MAG: hypothetical protein WDM81_00515 [Rhizomicrobium sp.]
MPGWRCPPLLTMITVAALAVRYRFAGRIAPADGAAPPPDLSRAFWF